MSHRDTSSVTTDTGKTFTIREVSGLFGLPASTLRYYEELGLLPDVGRASSGARIYREQHISRLNSIACFKRTGLSIARMQEFYQYEGDLASHAAEISAMMKAHEQDILRQLHELEADLVHIREKVAYYTAVENAVSTGEPIPRWDEFFS